MWLREYPGKGHKPGHGGQGGVKVYRERLQDPENKVGCVKPLIDARVKTEWLVDDSPKWLDLVVEEQIDRKQQRTVVEWSVVDD